MFPWQRRKYPYTNFHELNADWILDEVKDAAEAAETAAAEVQTWDDRITAANATAEQARLAANTANTVANQALQTAEGISDTANLALERSENALSVAGGADTAAGNAVTTANAASAAATSAAQVAATANNNANTALQQAGQAATSASAAQTAAANSATAAQTAQAQATAAAAAVANKAEVYRFMVNRPYGVSSSGESLDNTQWATPFQDLLAALDDTKKVPILSVRYETGTQGVYSTTVQVVPTIEQKDQSTIVLSWFNVPAAGSPVYTRLVVDAATELATYYEYALSGGGGGGYTLLASGTYTTEAAAGNMTIPVSYTGTPFTALVAGDIQPNAGNQTSAWVWTSNPVIAQEIPSAVIRGLCRSGATGDISFTAGISVSGSDIFVQGRSGTAPVLANTYRWYIWGTP